MTQYTIDITDEAEDDLRYYRANERRQIIDAIEASLSYEPEMKTTNRKELRDNPIATWELRIGKYRVFYEVDSENSTVIIVSAGHKEHNVLYIRGKVTPL
jgi:mRNA-degrading endonuclease RelE of RelBE toxin-antitoxin system